ncbi:hypothetical protein C8R42DRAFT_726724 [Lentinula raphanica]|nr:hypothetical protein C8R42DRAFT_726724 [Lentinula raphanica]
MFEKQILADKIQDSSASTNSSIGDFGSCTVPQIQFGVGFDNRKETSFEPVDQTSYPHGSAQNIDIITQFMCDQLVNACGADATAKATCASAQSAADTATAKTGAQADKFNAVFGIQTNFAAVPAVSDQGVTLGVDGASTSAADAATVAAVTATSAAASTADAATATDPCPATVTVTVSAADAAATTATDAASSAAATDAASTTAAATDAATATAAASSSATAATSTAAASDIGNFGSCSVPQIQFGVGFDGRRETSFEPVDQTSFNHGSADNIAVITDFICNTLTNSCGADATAKATCATAQAAAAAGLAQTGDQADKFNAVFGINTQFAQVPVTLESLLEWTAQTVQQLQQQPLEKVSMKNNSPLPTNAFTVTIGGSASHSAITTSAVASSTSSSFSTSLTNTSTQQTSTSSIGSVTDSASVTRNTFIPTPVASPSSTTQVNQLSSISSTSTTATPTTSSSISSSNLQTFTNALGNIPAPPVFDTGNGEFIVQGDSTFNNKQNALDRSCDVQHNDCGNAANANHDASFTVNDCDSQEAQCKTNAQT